MKSVHMHFIGLITATLLVGCGGGTDGSSTSGATSSDTTSSSGTTSSPGTTVQCKEIAPTLQSLNRKYATSKDDYDKYDSTYKTYKSSKGSGDSGDSGGSKGSGDSGGSHNEGRNCLSCHSFTSAGTVFTSLHASNNTPGAAGYRIKLSTGVVYRSARGTGNSRASSFPSGKFTAQVIDPNGNVVNSSADMSHDASRRACNSCHSSSGNNGAPGRITSKRLSSVTPTTTPTTTTTVPTNTNCTNADGSSGSVAVSFNSNVLPILSAKCKSCHGSNGRFKVTTANATHANITALKGSATAGGTYLIGKGSNSIGHGGGQVISTSSAEYTTIKAWVAAGAPNN